MIHPHDSVTTNPKEECPQEGHMRVYGSVTVGAKGQIVIPKEVREALNINPGDSLLAVTKSDKVVAFINSDLESFLAYMNDEMKKELRISSITH